MRSPLPALLPSPSTPLSQSKDCPGPWDLPIPHVWEYKETKRTGGKKKKYQLFSGSLQRLHCPFLPLFFFKGTSPSRLVPLEQSSVTAKPCPVPVQRHLHLDRRAYHVLPQLFPVSLQLFTQPLTQALVNPANAHGGNQSGVIWDRGTA